MIHNKSEFVCASRDRLENPSICSLQIYAEKVNDVGRFYLNLLVSTDADDEDSQHALWKKRDPARKSTQTAPNGIYVCKTRCLFYG